MVSSGLTRYRPETKFKKNSLFDAGIELENSYAEISKKPLEGLKFVFIGTLDQ